ncbi:hypothetical protein ASD65_16595 [Microbacterium sp. Root61]|uniref:hypothetical protein n=1 Tax=Microbacterium sp. Root61 TaxID=1736570 RepID=UPI0006F2F92D|nr:hypothetical protein [Microbacterium sp. Root61]KRA22495.1 hypothetical protein ASD65_16595 [Microbacterium sp. Root61]
MRKWVIRFVSLLLFDILVLLLIGWLLPSVSVGWSAIWAGILLTAATLWIKPLITSWFGGMAAKSAHQRTKAGEKVVQFALVLLVAYIVWVLTVLLSGVHVNGWFWGFVIPPFMLLIAWIIYDAIDDKVEARAGALYDKATGGVAPATTAIPTAPAVPTPETQAAQRELNDGLTDEQRRMLDELGKS